MEQQNQATSMALEEKLDELFINAMKGRWEEVLETYTSFPEVQKEKITKSEDTALHVAVADGQTKVALDLVEKVEASTLEIANNQGNTPLHIAAGLGDLEICQSLTMKNSGVITFRNHNGETPLFLAALFGKEMAFIFLHSYNQDEELLRRNNGDTVLHLAIAGEFFNMAIKIIKVYKNFVDTMNDDGLSPMSILASKPNAFKSSTYFGVFDRIIYYCLVVDADVEEKPQDIEQHIKRSKGKRETTQSYPENYEVCMNLLGLLIHFLQAIKKSLFFWGLRNSKGADEENPQHRNSSTEVPDKGKEKSKDTTDGEKPLQTSILLQGLKQENTIRWSPPNYYSFVLFFKLMMKALLIVLGGGVWRIWKIHERKELHVWAKRCMDELVKNTKYYNFYNNTGRRPSNYRDEFEVPPHPRCEESENNKGKTEMTPILIAAKMGVVEIVEKILDEFPVAIQDLGSNNKNVVLLAVENRQPQVFNLLLNRKTLKERAFLQLDNEGNSALHLAAQCKKDQPWFIAGGALQMQCEIRWYMNVEQSKPARFFPEYNVQHETPLEVFNKTHKELIKDASNSLSKTSNSCSVVAAVVASVVFATSTTVPGGLEQASGIPVLKEKPAFDVFAISSLVALCSSVTALVFFLSILAYRHRSQDFDVILPRKLLLAFTSLFVSIASMLVSFFAGHTFIVSDELRYIAYPLYAALCFPLAIFAREQLSLFWDLISAIFRKFPQQVDEIRSAI